MPTRYPISNGSFVIHRPTKRSMRVAQVDREDRTALCEYSGGDEADWFPLHELVSNEKTTPDGDATAVG